MFLSVLQPSVVSLFSSTGSHPLQLWFCKSDNSTSSSLIELVYDKTTALSSPLTSYIRPPSLVDLGGPDRNGPADQDLGYELDQTVLHMQSPIVPTTYIQCPHNADDVLGLKHPWMHLQVRNMGKEWSFEVGLVDQSGRSGILRMSTFQKRPKLTVNPDNINPLPLLHLPLSFPPASGRPLTAWATIDIHLSNFIPYFSDLNLLAVHEQEDQDLEGRHPWVPRIQNRMPSGTYSHITYVRVYATCRLRRIWFDEAGPGPDQRNMPWEFQLYSTD